MGSPPEMEPHALYEYIGLGKMLKFVIVYPPLLL